MAIIPIGNLETITEFGENDTLLINTANGVKTIKASKVGGESSGSGGSGSSSSSVDLQVVAQASGVSTSGYNSESVVSYTSFTLSTDKTYDEIISKARTRMLAIDGGLYWSGENDAINVREIRLTTQDIYPAAMLSQIGLSSPKDAIVMNFNSYYMHEDKGEISLYGRMGGQYGVVRILAEINGEITVLDPMQL